jgi:hypothetical protein
MTGSRRAWAARVTVAVACAAIVGSSSMSTASIAAEPLPEEMPLAATAERVTVGPVTVRSAGASQTLRVTIPEVMVGPRTRTADGTLDVPVLIAAGGPAGRVYVDPQATGCSWRLVPGEVTRVRCAAADRNRVRVLVVVLDDGRTLARRM